VTRQSIFFLIGGVLAVLVSRFDYTTLRQQYWRIWGILVGLILMVSVLGNTTRGAKLSIPTPLFDVQASELGKVLLCVLLAGLVTDKAREMDSWRTTALIAGVGLVPAGLVILQDLGSGIVYIGILMMVLFVGGSPGRHLAALAAAGLAVILLATVAAPSMGIEVLKPYQVDRLTSFLHPSNDPADAGYQQNQSQTAIGAGGKTGRGEAATQTKLQFLPEPRTDFAFATFGERYGFTGAGLVLSLYALVLWRALRILSVARDLFGALIAAGIVAMLLLQVFENVGMNIGIMPITGIPLPLFSYGGSSVISTLLAVGLLQAIYARGRAMQGKARLTTGL
jgi:rod shape determining protein RodA